MTIYNTPSKQNRTPYERIMSRTTTDPETGCLNFTGSICSNGYGHTAVTYPIPGQDRGKVKYEYAHRIAYQGYWDTLLPKGQVIAHTCDNPLCVNVDHLMAVTQQANVSDRDRKGRHYSWKLTPEQKADIYARWASRQATQMQLAAEYGVCQANISRIVIRLRNKAQGAA